MKKIFSVILLAGMFLFFGHLSVSEAIEFVMVNDYYAFTENGIEYYITDVQYNGEIYGGGIQAVLKGVRNGKKVDELKYLFDPDGTYELISLSQNERGYISSDSKANTVFNIIKSGKLKGEEKLINIQEIYYKAHGLFKSGNYSKAVSYYKNLLNQFVSQGRPNQWLAYTGKAYTEMGLCYVRLNDYEKAKECYDKAKTIKIESYDDEGRKYFEQLYSTMNASGKTTTSQKDSPIAKGDALFKEKKYDKAIEAYKTGLNDKNSPNLHEVYFKIALTYRKMKNYNSALQYINQAISLVRSRWENMSNGNEKSRLKSILDSYINRREGWQSNVNLRAI